MNDAPSMAELGFRLIGSLAVVVGLLLLIARTVNRRYKAPAGATVQVMCRQQLGRGTGVAVVSIGTRVLVVGTTEHQVSLLAEMDPEELLDPEVELDLAGLDDLDPEATFTLAPESGAVTEDTTRPAKRPRAVPAQQSGPLAGSVLSAQTWKQTLAFFTNHPPPENRRRAS